MPPSDSRDPFLRIPWTRRLLLRPDTISRVPNSRIPKRSGEDSLFADVLKTSRTIRSCLTIWTQPPQDATHIEEISTLMTLGDGLNGHPSILHGGIVASMLDEGMGILQMANAERKHLRDVGQGFKQGELPAEGEGSFTAFLNVQYLKPVRTPGALVVVAWYTKREGRKEFITAEVRQREGAGEDEEGVEVVCAKGEGLMVTPRTSKM